MLKYVNRVLHISIHHILYIMCYLAIIYDTMKQMKFSCSKEKEHVYIIMRT